MVHASAAERAARGPGAGVVALHLERAERPELRVRVGHELDREVLERLVGVGGVLPVGDARRRERRGRGGLLEAGLRALEAAHAVSAQRAQDGPVAGVLLQREGVRGLELLGPLAGGRRRVRRRRVLASSWGPRAPLWICASARLGASVPQWQAGVNVPMGSLTRLVEAPAL